MSVSPLSTHSDKGLMPETSALKALLGDQFTLSTHLIKLDYLGVLLTDAAPQKFAPFLMVVYHGPELVSIPITYFSLNTNELDH